MEIFHNAISAGYTPYKASIQKKGGGRYHVSKSNKERNRFKNVENTIHSMSLQ